MIPKENSFLNLLDRDFIAEAPERITNVVTWHGHIPFATALVWLLRPQKLVELGTHKGDSYCAFCQTVQRLNLDCKCFAVDSWEGDAHAGFYGNEVYEELKSFHDLRYHRFSILLKMRFDDALTAFADQSIDLLHIDGLHTYDAVKHDFERWLPKVSSGGVVLFHDIHEYGKDFGVWKFWEQIKKEYPSFEFIHSHGIGILGVGSDLPESLHVLFNSSEMESFQIRSFFNFLGLSGSKFSQSENKTVRTLSEDRGRAGNYAYVPNSPIVSVIIPAYNHADYLRETIYSVLGQSLINFELIIVDDGSTDHSADIIHQIEDSRIQYHYQQNQGAHAAINRGIHLSKGDYISILNSDDVYDLFRLELFVRILDSDTTKHALFSYLEFIDGKGEHIRFKRGAEDNWERLDESTSFKEDRNTLIDLLAGNFIITTSNIFCRKTVFLTTGLFENLRYSHDYAFLLSLCYHFDVEVIDEYLVKYRLHGKNTFNDQVMDEVDYEVGLILSRFLVEHDISGYLKNEDAIVTAARFFSSINTFDSDRMMMTILLFGLKFNRKDVIGKLFERKENPFKKVCVKRFRTQLDEWKYFQSLVDKMDQVEKRLEERDQRLAEMNKEAHRQWLYSQEAWKTVDQLGNQLCESEQKLSQMADEANRWWLSSQEAFRQSEANRIKWTETEEYLNSILNSRSYRLGRLLLSPFRKFLKHRH